MNDYPAAHSMDTDWFAIDRHGHVAVFDTGQSGPVPKKSQQHAFADWSFQFCAGNETTHCHFEIDDLLSDTDDKLLYFNFRRREYEAFDTARLGSHVDDCLIWFEDESAFSRARQRRGSALVRMPNDRYVLGYADRLSKKQIESYLKSDFVRRVWLGFQFEPHRFGFVSYDHDSGVAMPYERTIVPQTLVHIDQLSPELRKEIGNMHFPVDFARDMAVQPFDHTECATWGSGQSWISLDGTVHDPSEQSPEENSQ